MTPHSPKRLLHLLISADAGRAIPIVLEQQRSGAGRPTMVLGPSIADLTIPAGLDVKVLGGEFDERALLALIDEADSVCVW
jgi:hypothetical protein